jgi:NAD(P)H-quinone oxidoreductase subunit 5
MLDQSFILRMLIITLGVTTAIFAAMSAAVQTDVKSSLSLASLLQVSIIVVEIGLGLRYLALIHIIGHASMRTLQLLRAPSLLRDYRAVQNNLGYSQGDSTELQQSSQQTPFRLWCYRFAIERGYFDTALDERVARPFLRLFRRFDAWERRWIVFLSAGRGNDRLENKTTVSIVRDDEPEQP